MAFEWLSKFHQEMEKGPEYAQKTLAAYRLGMKANGSIVGVRIAAAPDCCEFAKQLPAGKVYDPADAPVLPLPQCPQGRRCGCVYRPVMQYEESAKR